MEHAGRRGQSLAQLEMADGLTTIERAAWRDAGQRHERSAAHRWPATGCSRLHRERSRLVDRGPVLTLLVVHDPVDVRAGDTFASGALGRQHNATRASVSTPSHQARVKNRSAIPPSIP